MVTQGNRWCEVADDPVVVSKAGPVKASNGVEVKTRLTLASMCKGASCCQKHSELREGVAFLGVEIASNYTRIQPGKV